MAPSSTECTAVLLLGVGLCAVRRARRACRSRSPRASPTRCRSPSCRLRRAVPADGGSMSPLSCNTTWTGSGRFRTLARAAHAAHARPRADVVRPRTGRRAGNDYVVVGRVTAAERRPARRRLRPGQCADGAARRQQALVADAPALRNAAASRQRRRLREDPRHARRVRHAHRLCRCGWPAAPRSTTNSSSPMPTARTSG